jgi:protein TonB
MIFPRYSFVIVATLLAIASARASANKPQGKALSDVAYVTLTQMWISAPAPEYPPEALKRHLTGHGVFNLKIGPKNYTVSQVTVLQSTGHKILDDAAIQALSRWRGRPSELMSRTDHVHVPVTFR